MVKSVSGDGKSDPGRAGRLGLLFRSRRGFFLLFSGRMRLFGMGLVLGVTFLGMGIMALFVVLRVMFTVLLVQTLRF